MTVNVCPVSGVLPTQSTIFVISRQPALNVLVIDTGEHGVPGKTVTVWNKPGVTTQSEPGSVSVTV